MSICTAGVRFADVVQDGDGEHDQQPITTVGSPRLILFPEDHATRFPTHTTILTGLLVPELLKMAGSWLYRPQCQGASNHNTSVIQIDPDPSKSTDT